MKKDLVILFRHEATNAVLYLLLCFPQASLFADDYHDVMQNQENHLSMCQEV